MRTRLLSRVLLAVLAGAVCGVAVTCGVLLVDRSGSVGVERANSAAASVTTASARGGVTARPAREALRRWDVARARAWSAGDAIALAGLYTPGSVAGHRDVAMLGAWTTRGARVTGLTTQILRLQVLVRRERRLVLVVTDRVAQARAAEVVLPRDRPSTRRLVLVRDDVDDPRWRVASVSPEPPGRS